MKNVKLILVTVLVLAVSAYLVWHFLLRPENINLKQSDATVDRTIIAFGDSLTAGYGLPLYESYPSQLEKKLQEKGLRVKVINAGVSGETSMGNSERASFIQEQKADMVIWGIGGNDALRALPLGELKNNMERTIRILQSGQNPPKILMLEMRSPANFGIAYKKSFDALYKDLSKKYNILLVPFLVPSVFLKADLMQEDRIHPNKLGYAKLIDDFILPAVLKGI